MPVIWEQWRELRRQVVKQNGRSSEEQRRPKTKKNPPTRFRPSRFHHGSDPNTAGSTFIFPTPIPIPPSKRYLQITISFSIYHLSIIPISNSNLRLFSCSWWLRFHFAKSRTRQHRNPNTPQTRGWKRDFNCPRT